MAVNKSRGNMYPFVSHTWNVVKGKCPHDCSYCYMKRYPQPELHFDEKELKTNLGSGKFIFVGSSCDMWADCIPAIWIMKILSLCNCYQGNRYLFQTKNPERFSMFSFLDFTTMLGVTIETNRYVPLITKAPIPYKRKQLFAPQRLSKMVSIEPIMDFDVDMLVEWIGEIKPEFVSIGADSGNNHLPEPSPEKVKSLIEALKEFTEVKIKDNLKRLL